ncbi:glycine zipper family protein [Lacihabitans sp. CCS-44]|uniref:YMGG-like glycine zipper-containing protein n=1 Tax=Lacihabitans sp. CCS-44 TaxID=2487331 RepID=UPI0020CCDE20|nr:YMGG-like glycine zipper-containing protein [Lacihabitans sp. CCS-44]MCP9756872.1 glycine zipper family protein [Lacihabitans sp. CCS-44]
MKKLLLLMPAFIVAASCTNPKSEVNTPAVEDAVVDSTSIKEAEKVAESKSTDADNQGAAVSSSSENKTTTTASTPAEKKKWSNKKKGAIIGATSGAVAGAVVSKKRVKGALIGGAVGAGVGLGAGAILDKKENN